MKRIDLTEQQFGRLTVCSFSHNNKAGEPYWNCKCTCGNQAVVRAGKLKSGHTKSCGCLKIEASRAIGSRIGSKASAWKGGRGKDKDGYVTIYTGPRSRSTFSLRPREHRSVMEQAIGRPLFDGETVHHKNGDRSDNRLENLELWNSWHPPGQRVSELVKWAKDILSRYDPQSLTHCHYTADADYVGAVNILAKTTRNCPVPMIPVAILRKRSS